MTSSSRSRGRRAVLLLSGGLDSTLAATMMAAQGIELFALHFTSPFCTCSRGNGAGCRSHAQVVAERLGIPIRTVAKGPEYIEIVRNPRHGRGSGMNPCIDCRIFTLARARAFMEEVGAFFLVTGEVVGQRPMSQRLEALRLIERQSGTQDIVLRPLSARHLPPTLPEREGWVDRAKLLSITGRSRKEQIRLAGEWGIGDYPCPAGGCLLTQKNFAVKVKDLFEHCEKPDTQDLLLLKIGRHFRIGGRKVIVARDETENRRLEALGRGKLALYVADRFSGPSVGMEGLEAAPPLDLLAKVYTRYSKPGTKPPFVVRQVLPGGERDIEVPQDSDFTEMERALLC